MASPMPLVPPVTSARLPVNSVSEEPLIYVSPLELPLAANLPRIASPPPLKKSCSTPCSRRLEAAEGGVSAGSTGLLAAAGRRQWR